MKKQELVKLIEEVLVDELKSIKVSDDILTESLFSDETLSTGEKQETGEKVNKFTNYQKYINTNISDTDIAEDLCNIVSSASKYMLSETDDWFDAVSVKRNLNELKSLAKQFHKTANERQIFTQRMQGLYEDMGNILNRYFEISQETKNEETTN
mgnify:CR=1 FL=1|jgi:hypothetical protein